MRQDIDQKNPLVETGPTPSPTNSAFTRRDFSAVAAAVGLGCLLGIAAERSDTVKQILDRGNREEYLKDLGHKAKYLLSPNMIEAHNSGYFKSMATEIAQLSKGEKNSLKNVLEAALPGSELKPLERITGWLESKSPDDVIAKDEFVLAIVHQLDSKTATTVAEKMGVNSERLAHLITEDRDQYIHTLGNKVRALFSGPNLSTENSIHFTSLVSEVQQLNPAEKSVIRTALAIPTKGAEKTPLNNVIDWLRKREDFNAREEAVVNVMTELGFNIRGQKGFLPTY